MATVIRGSDNFDTAYAKSVAIIADVKAQGVHGGSSLAASWNTRNLNTEIDDPQGIVSIASNQFTLQAGTYYIEWACPVYDVGTHVTRLWNVTTSSLAATGKSTPASATYNVSNDSSGATIQTVTSATAFKLQHYTTSAKASTGLGIGAPSGNSVFTLVKIHKIGA